MIPFRAKERLLTALRPLSLPSAPLVDTPPTSSMGTLDLHQELVAQANAALNETGLEPNPGKRAWLGGKAQVLLAVANFVRDDSPSAVDFETEVQRRLSKAAEPVKRRALQDDAQYEVGKIAGLNFVY